MQNFTGSLNRRQLLAGSAAVAAAALLGNGAASAQVVVPPPQPAPPWTPQSVAVTTNGTTINRTFLEHIPLAPVGQVWPAVIAYHGGGQNAAAMTQHWDSVRDLCVVVCPNALVRPAAGITEWEFARPGAAAVPALDL